MFLMLLLAVGSASAQRAGGSGTEVRFSAGEFLTSVRTSSGLAVNSTQRRMTFDAPRAASYFNAAQSVSVAGFPIAPETEGELLLKRRVPVADTRTVFEVGGADGGGIPVEGPTVETYTGTVRGEKGSKVYISFVNDVIFGSIHRADGSVNILGPALDAKNDPHEHIVMSADSPDMAARSFSCPVDYMPSFPPPAPPVEAKTSLWDRIYEVELALETDSEFFTATGGTVEKAQSYALALMSMVSAIYEEETGVSFRVTWLRTWTDQSRDPYNCKGNPYDLAELVRPYWAGQYKLIKRDLGHVMTSISFGGGGLGYPDALCREADYEYGFSTSSVQGSHRFPTYSFTYDVYIVAHELGHNFNAPHTHSCYFNPPLDTCVVDEGIQGGCFPASQTTKPNPGSIMSYCGATNNAAGLGYSVRMTFLPEIIAIIRKTAQDAGNCLGIQGENRLVLLHPHGQESYDGESDVEIVWSAFYATPATIEYSADAGKSWTTIVTGTTQTRYKWTLPPVCSNKMLVRLTSQFAIGDTSTQTFSIIRKDPSGLVAYYPFNENSLDESFCGLYPMTGGGIYSSDRGGTEKRAISFNGTTGLAAGDFPADFTSMSVTAWVKLESTAGVQSLVTHDWERGGKFSMHVWEGTVGGAFWTAQGGAPFEIWGTGIDANKWYHIAMTHDGSEARLYMNGVLVNNIKDSRPLGKGTGPLNIGSRGTKEYTKGALDDVRVYSRALTQKEVTALFAEAGARPQATTLISPDDGTADLGSPVILVWRSAPGADRYHVQVSTSNAFTPGTLAVDLSDVTTTTHSVNDPTAGTTYYWRIAGINEAGEGNWSPIASFTTLHASAPGAPEPVAPPDGTAGQPLALQLRWNATPGATRYNIQIATAADFAQPSITLDITDHATTTREISGLATNMTYYWRVAGVNSVGTGPWSNGFSFSTVGISGVEGAKFAAELMSAPVYLPGGAVQIRTDLPFPGPIALILYDELGETVRTIFRGEIEAGSHRFDIAAGELPAGSYHCRLEAGRVVESERIVIIR